MARRMGVLVGKVSDYLEWTEKVGLSKYPYGSMKRMKRLGEILDELLEKGGDEIKVKELCGKAAKYHVQVTDKDEMYLCTMHFSNVDIQYMITRKIVRYQRLENGGEKCQVEVRKREREELVDG